MESFLHTGKSILQPETLALGEQGLGAEARASEVRPRRGLGWAVWGQPEGARVWSPQCGKEPGLLLGSTRRGGLPQELLSPHALRQQGTTYTHSRGGCEPLLPSQTPEADTGCCCC